eukprot:gb/GECG01008216.1/.p1 GENE.gb/GECG01008216.1/~~gb/GECG01008216.1/.p1  ORF type:complete len:354 (+),score=40.77 gb/GECG01008216.1/:1-1062(+)
MQFLSTSILAQSEAKASRAVSFFTNQLGLRTLWGLQHLREVGRPDILSAGLQVPNGSVIEVMTIDGGLEAYTVSGQYDKFSRYLQNLVKYPTKPPMSEEQRPLKILAVSTGPRNSLTIPQLQSLSTFALPPANDDHWRKWISYGSYATGINVQPQVLKWDTGCSPSAPAETPIRWDQTSSDNVIRGIKEVVLSNDFENLKSNEERLRSIGFKRNPEALSVWNAENDDSVGIRLQLGNFSALVLETEELSDAWENLMESRKERQFEISEYGRKSGIDQGQILLEADDIKGLDLRVCSRREFDPFFNESQAAYHEDIDETLNPNQREKASLSCRSIAGMEVMAYMKKKFRFLKQL